MKSMGTEWRRIRWRDIEITGGGTPTVRMSGNATKRAALLGVSEVLVTITHTDTSALVMVAVGEEGRPEAVLSRSGVMELSITKDKT